MTLDEVITIYAEATPNPNSMKFVSNKMILANDSVDFRQADKVQNAPLASALFEFPYVQGVFIMNNFVSITKDPEYEWFDIVPKIKEFVKTWMEEGKESVVLKQSLSEEEESEVIRKIKQLLGFIL